MLFTNVLRAVLAGILLILLQPPLTQAAGYGPVNALSPQAVNQFVSDPASLLAEFPNGGAKMISEVRDLALSNPATLNALVSLLTNANLDQQKALGAGLGQAALIAVKTDQAYAAQIQKAVTASENQNAILALAAIMGDQAIGAAGGGGGGGGGGGQTSAYGGAGGYGGSTSTISSFATPTTATNWFVPSFSSGSTPGTASTITTITTSVSVH
jgi:hypothetical protein